MVSNVFHENKCFITFIRFYWVFIPLFLSWHDHCHARRRYYPSSVNSVNSWIMICNMRKFSQGRSDEFRKHTLNFKSRLAPWKTGGGYLGVVKLLMWFCDSPQKTQHQWQVTSDHLPASVTASSALILATLRLQITVHSHSHLPHITGYLCYFGDNKSSIKLLQGAIVVTTHLFDNRDGTDRFVHSPSLSPVRKAAPRLV